jgi:hypothetical protein
MPGTALVRRPPRGSAGAAAVDVIVLVGRPELRPTTGKATSLC